VREPPDPTSVTAGRSESLSADDWRKSARFTRASSPGGLAGSRPSGRLAGPGATYEYLEDGQSYDIPLRCLQARDIRNLFVAGRCLSASHEALGSARVIGTCLSTGEAAGQAAAREAARRSGPR